MSAGRKGSTRRRSPRSSRSSRSPWCASSAGLIERRLDPKDRRVRLLHLTAKARPVLVEMREIGAVTREEAMAGLSPEDGERLIETLIAIKSNLTERDAPAANEPAADELRADHIRRVKHG
jgi:MarR family transcriptional regulator, transcriptional regulator for hemolysin